ncbi:purple acid phosphatase family protein [Amycolatopsis circi]|uniref:purple acid phosphatase family protein n=1 Tax=Amycolatopsis circi TaxID=871959 RepID=UPI000E27F6D6|nr:metallophosphoesterase family protein [Amycolatopsis circi]
MNLKRRSFISGSAAVGLTGAFAGKAQATPPAAGTADGDGKDSAMLWKRSSAAGAPTVTGLHLQFGADASREVVVSWFTPQPVARPLVRFGPVTQGIGRTVEAETKYYKDGLSGRAVYAHHARLTDLRPDEEYGYFAGHEGAPPDSGVFRTAPSGRFPFTFTSFGDQGTSNLRKVVHLPPGTASPTGPYPLYSSDQVGSPASSDIAIAVERVAPLFNLVNGDLCYAAITAYSGGERTDTWTDWFVSNSRSARFRPWMPCVGNHENEKDNGPLGYAAYQTYFQTPASDADENPDTRGLWYSFTAGSVRVISLSNDDVAFQDGADSYVRGYSAGAQQRWLEKELRNARADRRIDWIVVTMHQPYISSAAHGNGSDLGVREAWGPLFDKYGVDLVVSGHDHHYERSHPLRGWLPNDTRTPTPASTRKDVIDTSRGTMHMVIGGGGNFATSNGDLFERPQGRVIIAKSDKPSPVLPGHYDSVWLTEDAPWASVQDRANTHGFAAFDVDPGRGPGDKTRMKVTYYTFGSAAADLVPVDRFVLERPRRDAPPK